LTYNRWLTVLGLLVMCFAALTHRLEAGPNWLTLGAMLAGVVATACACFYIITAQASGAPTIRRAGPAMEQIKRLCLSADGYVFDLIYALADEASREIAVAQGIAAGTDETPQAAQPAGQEPGPKDAPK
jgi:hypothetical protein